MSDRDGQHRPMCYADSMRRAEAEIARLFKEASLQALPYDFDVGALYRRSIKQKVPIARPTGDADGEIQIERALWDLIPSGKSKPFLRANARSDALRTKWPWKLLLRRRCIVPADGFYEPEKPAMAKGTVPWSFYQLESGKPFFFAGLFNETKDPDTGEMVTSYTIITTDANKLVASRKHNRMPVILHPSDAHEWLFADDLPEHLLKPYPANEMIGHRVADRVKNRREPDGPDFVEPVEDQAVA